MSENSGGGNGHNQLPTTNSHNGNGASSSAWWKPIVHFLTHSVVGSAIFIIIAIPALLLGKLVHLLEKWGVAPYVLSVLTYLEYFIVTVDAILVVVYLGFAGYRAIKEQK